MEKKDLTSFDKVFPMLVQKYETFLPPTDENIVDKMNSLITYLNKVGKLNNDVVKQWNNVAKWTMEDGLTEAVKEKIDIIIGSGDFDQVIADVLNENVVAGINENIENINTTLTENKAKLEDNAISPEDYTGNDLEKIQSAINDAIAQSRSVRFSKIYNITGLGSIKLETFGNRKNLHLIGLGGGIQKYDAGYIFTANTTDRSDFISQNMLYISLPSTGVKVWDGNKLINIKTIGDTYQNIDQIVNADNRWLQGFRMMNCTCLGGSGWAVSMRYSMDCSFENNVIEFRDSFIRNKYDGNNIFNSDNQNLRILNNVMESLDGSAMYLGSSFGCKISGNYFEANKGEASSIGTGLNGENAIANIDLSANKYVYSHMGLEVSNNGIQMLPTHNANHTPAIKWGFIYYDVYSNANVSTGRLHEIPVSAQGKIVSVGDVSTTDDFADNMEMIRKL